MRKELLWAAGIGISFGLIIAFGAWRINTTVKKEQIKTQSSPSPSNSPSEFKITLDKPENNDVVITNSVGVSGITKNLAWIEISGEKDDYVLRSADNGLFSQNVNLAPGVNQIKVTAYDPDGTQSIQKVLVVFSSSFEVSAIPSPSPGDNSTGSAIRQRVAEKVAEALNKPKAYLGVVTDIADSTIQIKSNDSQIKQISSSNDKLTVINQKGTNDKTVKIGDVAIGDYIVAMGYINSKSVLSAQRILITDAVTDPKIEASFGVVTDKVYGVITVKNLKTGKTNDVPRGTNTDVENFDSGNLTSIRMAAIGIGDIVIYVTDTSGDNPVIRTVFDIQRATASPTPKNTP